jgi:mannose-1-phosphate guanylyltransferase/mannose-6-phosphate isomerase
MPNRQQKIRPVILCGGAGTRLWPASRDSRPKQFIELVEPDTSTFRRTLERVTDPAVFEHPVVITASEARFVVAEQVQQAGLTAEIVLEPERRDSAAAVAVAAHLAARHSPDALVLILAADHVVSDPEAFVAACRAAAEGAAAGLIMTLGIKPTGPATGYGYIQAGTPLAGASGACGGAHVERFLEKPDAKQAERLVAKGALWNSGYFLFRADILLRELATHAPDILRAAEAALANATRDLDFLRLEPAAFAAAPKISIDYALMERTDRAGVLPVSFPWSDVGSWDAVWEVLPHDAEGNAVRGRVALANTRNSLVQSDGTLLTAVVGLDDVVVVSTPDAILVTSRARCADVKDLVTTLRAAGLPEADAHLRMYRPWGWYQRIDIGTRFQVKRIQVAPQGRLSLQKHYHRAEHWIVVKGTAEVTVNDDVSLVHENEAIYLPIGSRHRLSNPGKIPLELIEVQVGSYTGEDDIIRLEDVYGR